MPFGNLFHDKNHFTILVLQDACYGSVQEKSAVRRETKKKKKKDRIINAEK